MAEEYSSTWTTVTFSIFASSLLPKSKSSGGDTYWSPSPQLSLVKDEMRLSEVGQKELLWESEFEPPGTFCL